MNRRLVLRVGAVLCIVCGLFTVLHFRPGAVFFRRYNSVKLGMTPKDVEGHFGRLFDLTFTFRGCMIGYMSRGSYADTAPSAAELQKAIESIDEIPSFYGSAQFLFDPSGELVAYSFNGEDVAVYTLTGKVSGSALCVLDEEQWERIVGERP